MSEGPPNFHQLFNDSRAFSFESTARYDRSILRIDVGTAEQLGRELAELIGEWQTPTLNLAHFQARWVLKSVRATRQYQRFIVIE